MRASEEGTALPLSSGRWSDVSSVLPCATMNRLTNHQQPLVAPTTTCEPSYGKEEPLFQPHATRFLPLYLCILVPTRLNLDLIPPLPNILQRTETHERPHELRAQVIKSLNLTISFRVVRSNVSTALRVLPPATPPSCLKSRHKQSRPPATTADHKPSSDNRQPSLSKASCFSGQRGLVAISDRHTLRKSQLHAQGPIHQDS